MRSAVVEVELEDVDGGRSGQRDAVVLELLARREEEVKGKIDNIKASSWFWLSCTLKQCKPYFFEPMPAFNIEPCLSSNLLNLILNPTVVLNRAKHGLYSH